MKYVIVSEAQAEVIAHYKWMVEKVLNHQYDDIADMQNIIYALDKVQAEFQRKIDAIK